MKLYELTIEDEMDGVFAVSLVNTPAIESEFVALSKDKEVIELAEVSGEKRQVLGAALIPNKSIYRKGPDGEDYNIFFSKETIQQVQENFMKAKNTDNMTLENNQPIEGVSIIESWIKEGSDKSDNYGMNLPDGSWVIMAKVDSDDIWKEVKANKVLGFSIEGRFTDKLTKNKKHDEYSDQLLNSIVDNITKAINQYKN